MHMMKMEYRRLKMGSGKRTKVFFYLLKEHFLNSDGLITRELGLNPDFGFWKRHGEVGLLQVEQDFFFLFAIFDDFSKWRVPNEI